MQKGTHAKKAQMQKKNARMQISNKCAKKGTNGKKICIKKAYWVYANFTL